MSYTSDTCGPSAPRTAGPSIVAVGRLVRHKRLEQVVRLTDQLADAWPDLQVHLVGRGPDEPRIRAAVARLGDPSRVTVHGFLPTPEKDALLRTAWLHLSASQGEGWGLSVLEAAALGVPSVAYDVDGLRDAIRDGETGWLVAEGETLSATVSRALSDVESEPEYAGKTTLLILPDFGRDADDDPGGNGFQHHRTGDALSRTTWLMALGPGIREGVVHDRPVDSVDLVPTIGSMLSFSAALSRGKPIAEIV